MSDVILADEISPGGDGGGGLYAILVLALLAKARTW